MVQTWTILALKKGDSNRVECIFFILRLFLVVFDVMGPCHLSNLSFVRQFTFPTDDVIFGQVTLTLFIAFKIVSFVRQATCPTYHLHNNRQNIILHASTS